MDYCYKVEEPGRDDLKAVPEPHTVGRELRLLKVARAHVCTCTHKVNICNFLERTAKRETTPPQITMTQFHQTFKIIKIHQWFMKRTPYR